MHKMDYLKKLHDLAYQANMADTSEKEDWQAAHMASSHCQPLLDMVRSMLHPEEYQAFLDNFGDFGGFKYHMASQIAF
jgi:hypothetical protein